MRVFIRRIYIDTEAVNPSLTIDVDLEFYREIEVPISLSGKLKASNGKTLSLISEYHIVNPKTHSLRILPEADKRNRRNEKEYRTHCSLTAQLTKKAIDVVELEREKDQEKAVHFSCEFIIKTINLIAEPDNISNKDFIELNIATEHQTYIISQSDWINKYSKPLGIGDFLLLELAIPEKKDVSEFWSELYDKLTENCKTMNSCIRSGDWDRTLSIARNFYENAKIGDFKKGHAEHKEKFISILEKDNHSKEGIKNLFDGIWHFFQFLSKYAHEMDTDGNMRPKPIPTKEDAYLAYTLAIGLLNLIGKKIEKA